MNRVILLGTNICPKCQMVKDFLDKENIEYKYLNAMEDGNNIKYKIMSVPVAIIEDENGIEIDRAVNKEDSLIKLIKQYIKV